MLSFRFGGQLEKKKVEKMRFQESLIYCVKYRNFTWFPGVKTVPFHTRKLGEITVFYVV